MRADSPDGEFSLNIWDFGGQEIYHATHQYFLTKKAIYLFVWVARSDDDLSSFDFWLSVVTLLSDSAPILIVQNKCDERRKEIDEARIRRAFPNVVGFYNVSAKTNEGVQNLREQILLEAQRLQHFNQAVPVAWLRIRERLEKLNRPYVSYSEYQRICSEFGLSSERAEWLSDYFNVLGVFLHFPDNMVLADTLFLRPEWATNATYRLFDDPAVVSARGVIDNKIAKRAWSDYPAGKHPVLLELLKRFELCFELQKGKGFILPARLPASPPAELTSGKPDLSFFYEYDFMPAGVIERAIVRLNPLIVEQLFWKNGAKLAKGEATAIIYADRFKRRIVVDLAGKGKAELLTLVRNEIDQINISLNGPIARQMLPCNCTDCRKSDPYYFDYSEVKRAKAKDRPTIECRRSFEQVDIDGLVDRVDAKIGTKEQELLRLLTRVADKFDDEESLGQKANEIVRLQPNLFGVGVNLNYLISNVIKNRKKRK